MKNLFTIFVLVFLGLSVITDVHSFSDLKYHSFHLLIIFILGAFSLWIIHKEKPETKTTHSLYIADNTKFLLLTVLIAFSVIRVLPCHLLSSSLKDVTHINTIDHPCCFATTSAIEKISVTPAAEEITSIKHKPYTAKLIQTVDNLQNKSPPNHYS